MTDVLWCRFPTRMHGSTQPLQLLFCFANVFSRNSKRDLVRCNSGLHLMAEWLLKQKCIVQYLLLRCMFRDFFWGSYGSGFYRALYLHSKKRSWLLREADPFIIQSRGRKFSFCSAIGEKRSVPKRRSELEPTLLENKLLRPPDWINDWSALMRSQLYFLECPWNIVSRGPGHAHPNGLTSPFLPFHRNDCVSRRGGPGCNYTLASWHMAAPVDFGLSSCMQT